MVDMVRVQSNYVRMFINDYGRSTTLPPAVATCTSRTNVRGQPMHENRYPTYFRSSSLFPSFFWLRSRAACAFWTLEPFPMVGLCSFQVDRTLVLGPFVSASGKRWQVLRYYGYGLRRMVEIDGCGGAWWYRMGAMTILAGDRMTKYFGGRR